MIARTSSFAFKNKNIDIRNIGQQLGVHTLLEGSVRKAGNRVRVTAQLIQAADGSHIFSRNFDRSLEDIFALQDEVSLLIADQIRENFGHIEYEEQLVEPSTQNMEAYQLYLQGRHHSYQLTKEGFEKAISFFKQSHHNDPDYAQPLYGLVHCYGSLATWGFMPREEGLLITRNYFVEASKRSTELPEYYFSFVLRGIWVAWDFNLAHQYLLQTTQRFPNYLYGLQAFAEFYMILGKFENALVMLNRAIALDPLVQVHALGIGFVHYLSGDLEKATSQLSKAIAMESSSKLAVQLKLACHILRKQEKEMEIMLENFASEDIVNSYRYLYGLVNNELPPDLNLQLDFGERYIPWEVYFHSHNNNPTKALELLQQGVRERNGRYIYFQFDPLLAPIRFTEPFQQLVQNVFGKVDLSAPVSHADISSKDAKMSIVDISEALEELLDYVENADFHLDPEANMKDLAQAIQLHPNKLSWLLNEHLRKNFNEFVNGYRLATFKQKALDPSNQHLTLLAIAYDSGFNSKTVFNAFFKKEMGLTPRAWVQQQANKS